MVAGGLVGGHMQIEQVEIIDLIDSKFHYIRSPRALGDLKISKVSTKY